MKLTVDFELSIRGANSSWGVVRGETLRLCRSDLPSDFARGPELMQGRKGSSLSKSGRAAGPQETVKNPSHVPLSRRFPPSHRRSPSSPSSGDLIFFEWFAILKLSPLGV